jgi:3-mercaptopyruvate sulfurtransferase SseA
VQRAPITGAVNLGQVDWVLDEPASQRLQPPSVIGKILARAGIFPGTPVILFAGSRSEAIPIAKLALRSIGVDQISVLKDEREPMVPRPLGAGAFKRQPLAPGVLLTPGG